MTTLSYMSPPWAKRTTILFFRVVARATKMPPMNADDFERELRKLVAAHGRGTENTGCLACERCERCTDSTFLADCKNVARSNYCTACVDCTECSHSTDCTGCLACSHCEKCERCTSSAYLVRCVACSGCTYCFGCVGLSKKDFHILNEPYERKEWFAKVAELRRALGLRSA